MSNLAWPQIIIEAGLSPDAPVQGLGVFKLGDPTYGQLGTTNTLGTSITWSDLSNDLISFTINRTMTRTQGPLWNFQAGTSAIQLDNSSGNYDPDNLAGPYVSNGVSLLLPMVPVRIRVVHESGTYYLHNGFADGWNPAPVTFHGDYTELTLGSTDAFKVLAGINLAALGSPTGVNADAGARIRDILGRAGWYNAVEKQKIATGLSPLQGTSLGADALSLMQIAVDSEIGQMYVDGTGAVVFRNRQAPLTETRSNTVQAIFGDSPGTLHPEINSSPALNNNPGFDGSLSPWGLWNGATTAYSTAYAYGPVAGVMSLHGDGVTAYPQAVSEQVPVSPNQQYTAFATTYTPTGAQVQVGINWFDSTGTFISNVGGTIAASSKPWQVVYCTATAPSNAAYAAIIDQLVGTPASSVFAYFGYSSINAGDITTVATELNLDTLNRANDDTTIANDVQATRVNGTMQEVTDAASQSKYLFPRTYSRSDLILLDDPTALNWAQWVLYVGKNNENRFESIEIVPTDNPTKLWPQALGREIGDRIEIWWRPNALIMPIVKDGFITGITHEFNINNDKWVTRFTLQDASKYGNFLTLGNSRLGALGSNALAF